MKCSKLFFVALLSTVFFVSCSKDDNPVYPSLGNYENGFFVLNEGNATKGSVSFVKNDFSAVKNTIFEAENTGDNVGKYPQSMFFDGENAYIIGLNKITVVNRYSFKLITKIITGLNNPRYGTVINGRAYITNAGDFMVNSDDYIAVIKLSNNTIESPIPLAAIGEKIVAINNKLYVSNGAFGSGNSLTVVNPDTRTIIKTLTFGNSPNSIVENNGNLYVLCSNYTADSELVKINLTTDEIATTIPFASSLVNVQNLNIDNEKIYFTQNSAIFSDAMNSTTISETPLFVVPQVATLYGFTVKNNVVYIADAKDYVSAGKVYIYSSTGTLSTEITVGLSPNGFYFN
jgi:hypothetical protein